MKKVISLLLTALMAFSVVTVGAFSASAVDEEPEIAITAGSHIFFDNTNTQWTDVYFLRLELRLLRRQRSHGADRRYRCL